MKILKHKRRLKNKTPENVNINCFGLGLTSTTVKMSILLKGDNGSNITPIKIPMTLFTEIEKRRNTKYPG